MSPYGGTATSPVSTGIAITWSEKISKLSPELGTGELGNWELELRGTAELGNWELALTEELGTGNWRV